VKEPGNDDERLAALLARKLDRRQREQVLAELAASDDDHEVFADTASILRQIEEEDAAAATPVYDDVDSGAFAGAGPVFRRISAEDAGDAPVETGGVIPFRPRPRTRPWQRWGALAAGIGGIALAATLLGRQGSSAGAEPLRLAAGLDHLDRGLPGEWQQSFGTSRGGEGAGGQSAAAQAGALLVNLSVAVHARDTADIQVYSEQLRSRYEPAMPSSPFRRLSARPGAPADSLRRLVAAGTDRLADRFGREHLELGAWVVAARLAADGRNAGFFQGEGAVPRTAGRLVSSDAAAAQAMARVQAALPATGPPRWDELQAALDTLQTELTNE
jgi:hypothetical protein